MTNEQLIIKKLVSEALESDKITYAELVYILGRYGMRLVILEENKDV